MYKTIVTFCFCFISCFTIAQQKSLKATRILSAIKVDGSLDESVWNNADEATDFVMLNPDNGPKAPQTHKSTIKIVYDDNAIYIGAYLKDNNPSSIPRQFTQRDNIFGEADVFTVAINPYNDGINETKFYVTAAGTQADSKTVPRGNRNSNDFSINYVWDSKVKIVEDGWIVEIKIPYSSLRFSREAEDWSINFLRDIRSLNAVYSWNFIDRTVGKQVQYHGLLKGITDIKPPLRLSFLPFTTAITEQFDGENKTNLKFGLDVKYGISDAFTLDATLIPDFSQTGFDALSLNLGPFEQTFREQRQFFTEGVELFDKGNLFFSRRIGGRPSTGASISEDEEIIDSPEEVKVLNAIKLSGRTQKGLGIGVLNAITEATFATIKNTTTGEVRKQEIEPFTNYNVFVLDQQFNGNSSVALTNTNVFRTGSFRDANVSALSWNISTKSNSYNLRGNTRYSTINENGITTIGFSSQLRFSKTQGNFRFSVSHRLADKKFDNNDLGRQRRNNFSNYGWDVSYQTFKPGKWFNSYEIFFFGDVNYLFKPNTYTSTFAGIDTFFNLKNFDSFGLEISGELGNSFDYFEPRVEGRFFKQGTNYNIRGFYRTDGGKKLSSSFRVRLNNYVKTNQQSWSFRVSPRYRFSNKLSINYSLNFETTKEGRGFVSTTNTDIIFGDRDIAEIENELRLNYNFNTQHALSLNFRHLWTTVQYKNRFFNLLDSGEVQATNIAIGYNPDANFNVWNMDLSYNWQFAPASQAVLLYRNSIFNRTDQGELGFSDSLSDLFDQPIKHTVSLRIVYFLEYQKIKNIFKKRA